MPRKLRKEAKISASATPVAEEDTAGKRKRGRKRKSAASEADTPGPKSKVRISEVQVGEDEQEADAQVAWTHEIQVEESGVAPEPWRAPVARMW